MTPTLPGAVPSLAPSEIVLLRGAAFAAPAPSDAQLFTDREDKLDVAAWMRAAYLVAVVATVAAGAIRLEPVTRKRLFGLLTADDLLVSPTAPAGPPPGMTPAWPAGSLEARVQARVAAKPVDAAALYVHLLASDSTNPAWSGLTVVREGLAGRGLLEVWEEKVYKVFTTKRFVLPATTAALATDTLVERTRCYLADYAAAEPAVWRTLGQKLDAALAKRRASEVDPMASR